MVVRTEALRARKEASYERQERALFAAMCEIWPEPDRRAALRMVAMVGIGALRLALEMWRENGRQDPVRAYLDLAFEKLQAEV